MAAATPCPSGRSATSLDDQPWELVLEQQDVAKHVVAVGVEVSMYCTKKQASIVEHPAGLSNHAVVGGDVLHLLGRGEVGSAVVRHGVVAEAW